MFRSRWWFQPIWKHISHIRSLPQVRGKNKKDIWQVIWTTNCKESPYSCIDTVDPSLFTTNFQSRSFRRLVSFTIIGPNFHPFSTNSWEKKGESSFISSTPRPESPPPKHPTSVRFVQVGIGSTFWPINWQVIKPGFWRGLGFGLNLNPRGLGSSDLAPKKNVCVSFFDRNVSGDSSSMIFTPNKKIC